MTVAKKVIEHIREFPDSTISDIVDGTGCSKGVVSTVVQTLVEIGVLATWSMPDVTARSPGPRAAKLRFKRYAVEMSAVVCPPWGHVDDPPSSMVKNPDGGWYIGGNLDALAPQCGEKVE